MIDTVEPAPPLLEPVISVHMTLVAVLVVTERSNETVVSPRGTVSIVAPMVLSSE